ncbi:MAG: PQQ-binding-like beta-propeller repeat protein [Planctomycetota bacterium]
MLQGDTRNLPLQNIFQTLALNQQEGMLTIHFEGMERSVALGSGGVFLVTERPYESIVLKETLVHLRIMTEGEYQNVTSTASANSPPGDILLDRHLLHRGQVLGPVREHLLERVYEIFEWRAARYRFEVKELTKSRLIFSHPEYASSLQFPINSVLMEVARREDEWRRIRETIPYSHQIYRITCPLEQLEHFTSPDLADGKRLQDLFRLLNGEHPLADILKESPLPAFTVFSTLRALIEGRLAAPLDQQAKKALAEKLRNKFQTSRVAGIYRSILADNPEELEIRRRLAILLERKKGSSEELQRHLRVLAEGARTRGDMEACREYLKKLLQQDGNDLDALEAQLQVAAGSRLDREWRTALRELIDGVAKRREYERGAGFLLAMLEHRPGDGELLQEAAHFYLLAGKSVEAATAYNQAARLYSGASDVRALQRVVQKLEACDPRSAERWRKQVRATSVRRMRPGRLWSRVAGTFLIIFLLGALGFSLYEWDARMTYAELWGTATRCAELGEVENARQDLLEFGRSHPFSLVARGVEDDISRLEEIRAHSRRVNESARKLTRVTVLRAVDVERFISKGLSLRKYGDCRAALEHYESANLDTFPEAVAAEVQEQIASLRGYLEEARKLHEKGLEEDRRGDLSAAAFTYRRLLEDYPCSPLGDEVRLPLLIEVLPPDASMVINGVPLKGPSKLLRVPAKVPVELTVEADLFEPESISIDPRDHWRVRVNLQKKTEWVATLPAPVESEPLIQRERIFVASRNGRVTALSIMDGSSLWVFDLPGMADVLGGIRSWRGDPVFAGTDGRLYRISAAGGKEISRLDLPTEGKLIRIPPTPPGDEGRTYLITARGTVIAVDLGAPKVLWTRHLAGAGMTAPVVTGDLLVAASRDGRITALDSRSGEVKWSVDLEDTITSAVTTGSRVALVGSQRRGIHALALRSGKVVWRLAVDSAPQGRIPLWSGRFAATTENGSVLVGSLKDGSVLWRMEGGVSLRHGPLPIGDSLATLDEKGVLTVYDQAEGTRRWIYTMNSQPGCAPVLHRQLVALTGMDHRLHLLGVRAEHR